jgi:hypothetical protein
MGADPSSQAFEAPIIFTAPFFAPPPSRAPPLFSEAGTPTPSRVEESPPPQGRGRPLGAGRPRHRGSPDPSQDSRVRSGAGSGKIRAAWWESPTEEVSLQLVGGRVGPNMSSVASSSIDHSPQDRLRKSLLPTHAPHVEPYASASGATHLESAQAIANEDPLSTTQATSLFNTKPFEIPSPHTPSSSSSGKSSAASSFAYQLRRRLDGRLLRKRYKPAQHTQRQIHEKPKISPPLQSPTYGIPKVVEDSRDETLAPHLSVSPHDSLQAFLDKSSKIAVTSLKLPPPKQLRNLASNTSSEHRAESPSNKKRASPGTVKSWHAKATRPGILRSSPSRDVTEVSGYHQARPGPSPLSRTSSRDSPRSTPSFRVSRRGKQTSSSSRATPLSPSATDPVPAAPLTPCSNHTGKSESKPFQTDEGYFSTLRTKMTERQGFTPTLSPTQTDQAPPSPLELDTTPQAEDTPETWPVMSTNAIRKRQKRGSIFSVFGLPAPAKSATPIVTDELVWPIQDQLSLSTLATWPPRDYTEMGKAQWRRMSEDRIVPQYFARRRKTHTSSDATPSPTTTSNSTRPSRNGESSSLYPDHRASPEEIGPLSQFTPLPPLREDYDRSRRVSIEIPGTPGVRHHPMDTPSPSLFPVTAATSSRLTIVPVKSAQTEPIPTPDLTIKRRFTLEIPPPTNEQASDPEPPTASTRKRSTIFQDITSELVGSPNRRKSSSHGDRPLRRLQRRRSAITPIARQATSTSTASKATKPLKRSIKTFKKPLPGVSLAANPKE